MWSGAGGLLFDPLNNVTEQYHRAVLESRLRQGYDTVHLHRVGRWPHQVLERAAQVLRRVLRTREELAVTVSTGGPTRYLLFFDGGSRGIQGQVEVEP